MSIFQERRASGRRADAVVIEIQERIAGIVASDGRAFRFFSSERAFDDLEGRVFASPRHAERAARALIAGGLRATDFN